ncbi:MAG: glycoside hydrolase [Mycobacterium sp.]|nr:glycoside hydrolase [Mycobacterium sp.]
MTRRFSMRALVLAVATATVFSSGCAASGFVSHAEPAPDPNLILATDFDGPEGAPVPAPWHAVTGGGGWGNNEAQTYTADPANVRLDGRGNLVLSANTAPDGNVTSARITTADSFSFTYGRAEARVSLPAGQGLHPAFWLLGSDIDAVGWPESGEIDFHTYWVERTPGRIVTGIDGVTLFTATPADLPGGGRWVFDQPFHLLLNLAVGGNWPGPADASTPNPSTMLVDWVRVSRL